jgi:hypothetical protein
MKTLLCALTLSVVFTSSAYAQCYGDAADAFGCGVSRPNEATLESFGDSRNEVVPDYYGNSRPISASELFSEQETLNYYRRLYRGWRGNNWSESALRNSMNSQSRPLRPIGNTPSVGPRF